MAFNLIVATDKDGLIGYRNQDDLPWGRVPEDMSRFVKLTTGATVVMGRTTYQTLDGALPKRQNIILSSDPNYKPVCPNNCVKVINGFNHRILNGIDNVFIIGGAQVYRQAFELNLIDTIYFTRFNHSFSLPEIEQNIYFPEVNLSGWTIINCHRSDIDRDFDAHFFTLKLYCH